MMGTLVAVILVDGYQEEKTNLIYTQQNPEEFIYKLTAVHFQSFTARCVTTRD